MAKLHVNSGVTINHSQDGWSEFKRFLGSTGDYAHLGYTWVEDQYTYTIVAIDGAVTHLYSFSKTDEDTVADFEASYKARRSIEPRAPNGAIRRTLEKSDGIRANFYTPNWCDKTTWYQQAVRVVNEVATDTGDRTTYDLAHENVIDTYHGKLTQEDFLLDAANHTYRVTVKVNNVTKTEQDPHYASGGDYTIDYAAGTITFLAQQAENSEVTVTYHYATSSLFTITPDTGRLLVIDEAEVQVSTDVDITDTLRYAVYGYVDVFAPQLMPGVPSGTKIPLGTFVYKTLQDYLNDSMKLYPTVNALGGATWRGMSQPITIFRWDYIRALNLNSMAGMDLRLWLEHDEPFGGASATATFYCGSEAL